MSKYLKSEKKDNNIKNIPNLNFDPALPITAKKDQIIDAIRKNRVVIISGETGSGKTTQIPKFCIAAGRGTCGIIGCTQPRRIAAITVAKRIAYEMGEDTAGLVGYKIRFHDKTCKKTLIKIMTDGVLLAETISDRFLRQYDTIIVDEAHERSLNIDFILGFLKSLLGKRKDLNIIITSATIDTEKFSRAFDGAPVIEVSGRMFPVETRYFTDNVPDKNEDETDHVELAVRAVDTLHGKSSYGDILIFMPTEQDIRETCEAIEGRYYKKVSVFPLFARMPAFEQAKIFKSAGNRKIIVATNVAETSLTIPGIKYVIDTGLARISRYSPRLRITSIPVEAISKSSADQRKGRCGRVENGVCIRLFSEEDFNNRPLYTSPEILRANLAEVILRMMALKLGDILHFPFIDVPHKKSITDGINLLAELNAIAVKERKGNRGKKGEKGLLNRYYLTKTGRLMAKMPVDPRLARILMEADKLGCVGEIAIIAAALSIQDPRQRPSQKTKEADLCHEVFKTPSSDFITLLNIWNVYHKTWKKVKTANQMRKFCKKNYLSFRRMQEWRDIHNQLLSIMEAAGKDKSKEEKEYSAPQIKSKDSDKYPHPLYQQIHKAVLSGFLSNIAVKKEKNIFKGAKDKDVMIFPGSVLFNESGRWIIASEIIETSRLYAMKTANIESGWIEEFGKDLCKYTYQNPHWEKKRGEVVAQEQISLYGLILDSERSVSYGKIDSELARDIFIRNALVHMDVKKIFPFMEYNRQLIKKMENLENKLRKRDILIGEDEIYSFYSRKLGDVYDTRTLSRLIKKKGGDDFLCMTEEEIIRYSPDEDQLSLFPDKISIGKNRFECIYKFNPGQSDDGLTIKIPSVLTRDVLPDSIDWLVPGFYREKITVLIKLLPKKYRKQLVPVSDTVDIVIKEMPLCKTSILTELGKFLYKRFSIDIPAHAWPEKKIPEHLRAGIAILDQKGQIIRAGKDKNLLLKNFEEKNKDPSLHWAEKKKMEKTGLKSWNFGDIAESIIIKGEKNRKTTFFPGLEKNLKDNAKTVNLRLFQSREKAVNSHKDGVFALASIGLSKDLGFLKKSLILPQNIKKKADYFGGCKKFQIMLYNKVLSDILFKNIRTGQEFDSLIKTASKSLFTQGRDLLNASSIIIDSFYQTRFSFFRIEEKYRNNKTMEKFITELRLQLERLLPENFIMLYDTKRLIQIPRYIQTLDLRAKRGVVDQERDCVKWGKIKFFTDILEKFLAGLSPVTSTEKKDSMEELFWIIEEYKVSVFAQELKTLFPVSEKRIQKKVKEIERMV